MRVTHLAYVLSLAATTGLGSAWAMLGESMPFSNVRAGAWVASPRAFAPDPDPYARAILTQRTHLPLGIGEGLAFAARQDSQGRALTTGCDYRITGIVPPSRGWSLGLSRLNNPLEAGPGDRISFTDAEVTRPENGTIDITLSQQVQPGDWLPLPDIGAFRVILRLYDTPVSGTASELTQRDLPAITRGACR
jgi:hypothetical protein